MPAPLKRVEISAPALKSLLTTGTRRFKSEIPFEAEVVRAGYDPERDVFYATFEHESFDMVDEAEPIPVADVTVTDLEE